MDCLSAYSALNQGHCHPRLVATLKEQADKLTLTSRAFNNDQTGPFFKELADLCKMEMVLPMNSGAEAVETAIKTVRKWGYTKKGVAKDQAEIIVFDNNFHGPYDYYRRLFLRRGIPRGLWSVHSRLSHITLRRHGRCSKDHQQEYGGRPDRAHSR